MQRRSVGFPRASLRVYLIALILALLVPMFTLSAILLAKLEEQSRHSLEDRVTRTARNIAITVNGSVQNMVVTAEVLSSAPELDSGDLGLYHHRTQAALREGSMFLIMVDGSGQQLFNTRVPYGTDLGQTSNMQALKSALAGNKAVVSDVFFGQTSQKWVFNVILPLQNSALPNRGAMILTQNADELLPSLNLDDGWQAAIVDHSGRVLDATNDLASGDQLPEALFRGLEDSAGVMEDAEGLHLVGYANVDGARWKALVWAPATQGSLAAPVLSTLLIGFIVLTFVGVALAYLLGETVRRAVGSIANMAGKVGAGQEVEPVKTRIVETSIVAEALADASRRRKSAEDQIQLILRELAHRTKNLISVVQGLISQSARHSGTPRDAFMPLMERLSGLGRSIDLMTGAEWVEIPLHDLAERQLEPFGRIGGNIFVSGPEVLLKPDAVQNLGLVLYELATNATKFGAFSHADGRVNLEWRLEDEQKVGGQLRITWTESGGPPIAPPSSSGFGATVLKSLAEGAFQGHAFLDYGVHGFSWTLTAPLISFTG